MWCKSTNVKKVSPPPKKGSVSWEWLYYTIGSGCPEDNSGKRKKTPQLHFSLITLAKPMLTKIKKKYTNPARGILDFCKQKLWPLPCSQLTHWLLTFKSKDEPTVLSFWCWPQNHKSIMMSHQRNRFPNLNNTTKTTKHTKLKRPLPTGRGLNNKIQEGAILKFSHSYYILTTKTIL